MDRNPGSGSYAPTAPAQPELLYDRDVRTRVFHGGADRIRAIATLKDDTLGPHGFATGTVVALSSAARHTYEHPKTLELTPAERFGNIAEQAPQVVNSCAIWHEDGDLVRQLRQNNS